MRNAFIIVLSFCFAYFFEKKHDHYSESRNALNRNEFYCYFKQKKKNTFFSIPCLFCAFKFFCPLMETCLFQPLFKCFINCGRSSANIHSSGTGTSNFAFFRIPAYFQVQSNLHISFTKPHPSHKYALPPDRNQCRQTKWFAFTVNRFIKEGF